MFCATNGFSKIILFLNRHIFSNKTSNLNLKKNSPILFNSRTFSFQQSLKKFKDLEEKTQTKQKAKPIIENRDIDFNKSLKLLREFFEKSDVKKKTKTLQKYHNSIVYGYFYFSSYTSI
ncbi:hypothetical protein HERIO_2087 [Hepatospora eriocheir]|uniref:Uncharacterized protein n=1 Tax=Hepatospora eriocheir TaxID=1081669 RepID=A0A1X0Q883_9MICR|nr:hypothetical protein HERIO_2087 [Hepatospora eriocheir]